MVKNGTGLNPIFPFLASVVYLKLYFESNETYCYLFVFI